AAAGVSAGLAADGAGTRRPVHHRLPVVGGVARAGGGVVRQLQAPGLPAVPGPAGAVPRAAGAGPVPGAGRRAGAAVSGADALAEEDFYERKVLGSILERALA